MDVSQQQAQVRVPSERDLDRVGWAPWSLIQILAILAAAVAAALALKS